MKIDGTLTSKPILNPHRFLCVWEHSFDRLHISVQVPVICTNERSSLRPLTQQFPLELYAPFSWNYCHPIFSTSSHDVGLHALASFYYHAGILSVQTRTDYRLHFGITAIFISF